MLKIESNLKISGRHWGLAFVDGIAYTTNASLAAKLLLKGYVVTDQQPEHTVAGAINIKQESSPNPSSPTQSDTFQTAAQLERPVSNPRNIVSTSDIFVSKSTVEVTKPKSTKPRNKAVTADAADKR